MFAGFQKLRDARSAMRARQVSGWLLPKHPIGISIWHSMTSNQIPLACIKQTSGYF
jgi:hypothetical protein